MPDATRMTPTRHADEQRKFRCYRGKTAAGMRPASDNHALDQYVSYLSKCRPGVLAAEKQGKVSPLAQGVLKNELTP
jgi:hypothetical protein